MEILRAPLVNANEDEVRVAHTPCKEGDAVRAGDVAVVVESTKAAMEVEFSKDGYLRILAVKEGDRVRVGDVLCVVTDTLDEPAQLPEDVKKSADLSVRATKKALAIAEEHGVELSELGGGEIIRERDVLDFVEVRRKDRATATDSSTPLRSSPGEQIIILGAGGHGRAVTDLVRQCGRGFHLVAAVDDSPDAPSTLLGVPVDHSKGALDRFRTSGVRYAVVGVGAVARNRLREELYKRLLNHGFLLPNLVHPRSVIEPSVIMGEANQIFGGAIIGSNVRIAENTIVNSGAVLSHDCTIGAHAHITPGAILAGGVHVGAGAVIGMGVTIYLGVRIGENAVIANGTTVTRDVPDGVFVKGPSY